MMGPKLVATSVMHAGAAAVIVTAVLVAAGCEAGAWGPLRSGVTGGRGGGAMDRKALYVVDQSR